MFRALLSNIHICTTRALALILRHVRRQLRAMHLPVQSVERPLAPVTDGDIILRSELSVPTATREFRRSLRRPRAAVLMRRATCRPRCPKAASRGSGDRRSAPRPSQLSL